jgi:predicted nucleic acid-binding Zn ribbon protein
MNTIYINFVQWAIQTNLSADECFIPFCTEDATAHNVPKSKEIIINKKKPIPECILKNMHEHNTTEDDAYMYETHCHNCGLSISIGKRYCCEECFKVIEKFNYKCNWNTTCKMCYIYTG